MNKKNVTITVITGLVVMMIFSLVLTGTYSLYSGEVVSSNKNQFNTGTLSMTANHKSSTINLNNTLPMPDSEGVKTTPYIFTVTNTGNIDYKFNINLVSTSTNSISPQYIKILVDNGNIMTFQNSNGMIKSDITLPAGESRDVSIRIWLDELTPNSEIGKSFESRIEINGENIVAHNLIEFISNKYNDNTKTVVTNNSINYNYTSTDIGLMNDGFNGLNRVGLDEGNIRYYGKTPNNYIDIGDPDNLYRIIGLFKNVELADGSRKDLIKVIKAESITEVSFDSTDNSINAGKGTNNWSTSKLMKLLNSGYENEHGGSLWWNRQQGEVFLNKLLDNHTRWFYENGLFERNKELIEEVVWDLGGYSTANIFPNEMYIHERDNTKNPNNDSKWTGKVALMYPSDYGYSVDLRNCHENLYGYQNCQDYLWLYNSFGLKQQILAHTTNHNYHIFAIDLDGHLTPNHSGYHSATVTPSFFLKSDLNIVSGNGSKEKPYIIKPNINNDNEGPTISNIHSGAMLYDDPTFNNGWNHTDIYYRGAGTKTMDLININTPVGNKAMKMTTIGSDKTRYAGLTFRTPVAADMTIFTKMIAKIPDGFTLNEVYDYMGDEYNEQFLSPVKGTGDWNEYITKVYTGRTGTFTTSNYYVIEGANTPEEVTWYVAYLTAYSNATKGSKAAITFTLSDMASGVVAYGINQSSTTEPTYKTIPSTSEVSKVEENITQNGTYYIWAKDGKGNVSKKAVTVNNIG